jgi:hypothetical protein
MNYTIAFAKALVYEQIDRLDAAARRPDPSFRFI